MLLLVWLVGVAGWGGARYVGRGWQGLSGTGRRGLKGHGKSVRERRGRTRLVVWGWQGSIWLGTSHWLGEVWNVDVARTGRARQGMSGGAGYGGTRLGMAWLVDEGWHEEGWLAA